MTSLNLEKGEMPSLIFDKSGQSPESGKLYIGAGWDAPSGKSIDLDLIACAIEGDSMQDGGFCYFNQLGIFDGAIQHSGDNTTGEGDGDDESLVIDFSKMPEFVTHIMIILVAYSGNVKDLSDVGNSHIRICDGDNESAPEMFNLPVADDDVDGETGVWSARITRDGNGWTVENLSRFITGVGNGVSVVKHVRSQATTVANT